MEDTIGAFRTQVSKVFNMSYEDIQDHRSIENLSLVEEQLELVKLASEMKPKDASDVWDYYGNKRSLEIPGRIRAAHRLFELASLQKGCRMLITYPPLVSVFSKTALDSLGVKPVFLFRSERASFILAACEQKPDVIIGESSFLKAALTDALHMDMLDLFPKGVTFLAAGTPLDLEFPEVAKTLVQGDVHDLYGCQEFGFLTLDGIPLREDLTLLKWKDGYFDLLVGGIPTSDCFHVSDKGHSCNRTGKIITYSRKRKENECQVTITHSTANGIDTLHRLAKTILRIKARIIRIAPDVALGSDVTRILISNQEGGQQLLEGPVRTELFDSLLHAQTDYQAACKRDSVWLKGRSYAAGHIHCWMPSLQPPTSTA